MPYVKSGLEYKKSFFEGHLIVLKNIQLEDAAGKIDETARDKLFQEVISIFPFYLAYTELGKTIFKKSWNYPWKLWTYIPGWNSADSQSYYEIGEAAAKKNPKLLYNQLKEGYEKKIKKIDIKLNLIKLHNLYKKIKWLNDEIYDNYRSKNIAPPKDTIEKQRDLVTEADKIKAELAKHKIVAPYMF